MERPVGLIGGRLRRSGWLLAETMVAMILTALLIASVSALLSGAIRWSRSLSARADALEVVRTVWVVLGEETRTGRPGLDWHVVAKEELALRSFQGVARICESGSTEAGWTVAYRGRRPPDPDRDSLLVLRSDGDWQAMDLTASAPSEACEPLEGEIVYRWVTEGPPPSVPVLARNYVFGSYHLADRAFRYRGASGGRQPLTAEVLSPLSGFRLAGDALEVTLVLDDGSADGGMGRFAWLSHPTAPPR
jgi:hypothetical protein